MRSTNSATTVAELYLAASEKHAHRVAFRYFTGHPYEALEYGELRHQSLSLAAGLVSLGLRKGDRVLLVSENRPEWAIVDFALACVGAVNVPVHTVFSSEQVAEVIRESRPQMVIASGPSAYGRLAVAQSSEGFSAPTIMFDVDGLGESDVRSMRALIDEHSYAADRMVEAANQVTPDDLMTITFTSGTTGRQKGVRLTHRNLMANVNPGLRAFPYAPSDRLVSVLPLTHVYERVAGYYGPVFAGSCIRFIRDVDEFRAAAKDHRPTVVVAVPRLFEKIREISADQASSSALKRRVFDWAFDGAGENRVFKPVFEKLVYSRVREVFGGELRCAIIGGARLPLPVSAFFDRVGIPLLEGYGLTETSPIVSTNREVNNRYGTVGLPLDDVLVRIADDGEIQVKGDTVMQGYISEEDTREVFTEDGWFKTGDLGSLDSDGHLTLTGRKKDLIVLTTGKKIAPAGVEEALTASPYVEQACVVGDGRKHICAILVPKLDALRSTVGDLTIDGLAAGGHAYEFLAVEVARATGRLSSIEQVRAFVVASEPFTQENGLLTATLKMRRQHILDRHAAELERLYQ